jgi:hypothetical protein
LNMGTVPGSKTWRLLRMLQRSTPRRIKPNE